MDVSDPLDTFFGAHPPALWVCCAWGTGRRWNCSFQRYNLRHTPHTHLFYSIHCHCCYGIPCSRFQPIFNKSIFACTASMTTPLSTLNHTLLRAHRDGTFDSTDALDEAIESYAYLREFGVKVGIISPLPSPISSTHI